MIYRISLYYFLRLHLNLELFQNFKFRRTLAAGIMNEGESRLNNYMVNYVREEMHRKIASDFVVYII